MNDQAGHKLSDILWYAEDAIIPIRKNGWNGTLVIDSLAMAQSPHPILQYGQVSLCSYLPNVKLFIKI